LCPICEIRSRLGPSPRSAAQRRHGDTNHPRRSDALAPPPDAAHCVCACAAGFCRLRRWSLAWALWWCPARGGRGGERSRPWWPDLSCACVCARRRRSSGLRGHGLGVRPAAGRGGPTHPFLGVALSVAWSLSWSTVVILARRVSPCLAPLPLRRPPFFPPPTPALILGCPRPPIPVTGRAVVPRRAPPPPVVGGGRFSRARADPPGHGVTGDPTGGTTIGRPA